MGFLSIVGGTLLGKLAPNVSKNSIFINGASVVSIPIAICLFFMMVQIMVKIDFGEVIKASRIEKPVYLTLFVN